MLKTVDIPLILVGEELSPITLAWYCVQPPYFALPTTSGIHLKIIQVRVGK